MGSSSAPIRHQLPHYPRRQIDNDDLLASIDRTNQNLASCLSLAESALAMIQGRSPPEADSVRERLARAEARIIGETSTTIFYLFLILPSRFLIILSLNPLDLTAQLGSLRSAADHTAGFVNARGAVLVVRLHDIPNSVREVALRGVRHGAAMALAAA